MQTIYSFRELLETDTVRWIRPDTCVSGGFTVSKKIAAMAEAYQVGLIPHHPLSPVCSASNVQLEIAVPNPVIHEWRDDDAPGRTGILIENAPYKDGYMLIPEKPGLGVRLDHEGIKQYAPFRRTLGTATHLDGSVADR